MKTLIALMCALSIGCATAATEFEDRLITDKIIVLIEFYDDLEALQAICGENTVGCTQCNAANTYCVVLSVKHICVVEHEMDHVLFGQFHEGIAATCQYRALPRTY